MIGTSTGLNPQLLCAPGLLVEKPKLRVHQVKLDSPDIERWESFIREQGSIFASPRWAALQCEKRQQALFLAVEDRQGICGACSVVVAQRLGNAFGGKFVIQGNPVIRRGLANPEGLVDSLLQLIETEARRRRILAIEFEGLWSMWRDSAALERHGYEVRGLKGWIVDLEATEAQVHSCVASSYRNLKNQAQKKHNVSIQDSDDVEALFGLWRETYQRAGKRLSSGTLGYLKRVYAEMAPSKSARIRLASKEGRVLSGCFNLYFGDIVYYWHGGSVSGERYGASHLLHWSVIRDSIGTYRRYHMGGSWLLYQNEISRKQAEGVSTFKRLWGAKPHDFYVGRKVLRPFAHRAFTCWVLPFAKRIKALRH